MYVHRFNIRCCLFGMRRKSAAMDHSKHCIMLSAALKFSESSVVTNDVRLKGAFEVRVCEHCLNGRVYKCYNRKSLKMEI